MPRASAAQTMLPLDDHPEETRGWDQIVLAAFADPDRTAGFLSQAEAAARAQPGDGRILLLAATAALLDQNPERAQVFLKRFSKRYVAIAHYQLLRALVFAEENKLGSARSVLEAHGLASKFDALPVFLGGWTRRAWLFRQHDRIFERNKAAPRKRATSEAGRSGGRTQVMRKPREARDKDAPAPVADTPDALPGLPLIDVDIPLNAALDLAPLLSAMRKPPESDGGWYGLSASPISASRRVLTSYSACRTCAASRPSGTSLRPCARCSSSFTAGYCSPTKSGSARPSKPAWCSRSICCAA
jgi:hypothetical protein